MYHFAWADQRPVQGNISYISLQPGQYIYCPGSRARIEGIQGYTKYTLIGFFEK